MTRSRESIRAWVLLGPTLAWITLFLLTPIGSVVAFGFASVREFRGYTFDPITTRWYSEALDPNGIIVHAALLTLGIAVASTVLSLLVGYAMAYYIARLAPAKWRGTLMALVVIPFWISFVVRVYGILGFIQEDSVFYTSLRSWGLGGLVDGWGPIPGTESILRIGSPQIVIFVLVYVWIPFMVLPLFTSLSKLDPQLLEAALDLGASRLKAFLYVTLPLTFPGVVTGSILVFITSMGAFVEPKAVGGASVILVGNWIQDAYDSPLGFPRMAATSIFVISFTLLFVLIYTRYADVDLATDIREGRVVRALRRIRNRLAAPRPSFGQAQDGGTAMALRTFQTEAVPRNALGRALDGVVERAGKWVLGAITLLAIVTFFAPLILTAVESFNFNDTPNYWAGFTLDWYTGSASGTVTERLGVFNDPEFIGWPRGAIWVSVIVAMGSTAIALLLGTMGAFALARYGFRGKSIINNFLYLGLVIPSLVLGISILILITLLNTFVLGPMGVPWQTGLSSIVVGHATFNIPLATIVVLISLREFDRSLEEAAMNLGADEITTFFRVTLPIITPGIVSAALLCFTFSFDELPVSLFLQGQQFRTLPVIIYGKMSKHFLSPEVNAASTLILVLAVVFVLMANKVQKGGALFRI